MVDPTFTPLEAYAQVIYMFFLIIFIFIELLTHTHIFICRQFNGTKILTPLLA